jgi:hypothetical protein
MYVWDDWNLTITVDQVLQSQGIDPVTAHLNKPALVATAKRSVSEFSQLLVPRVALSEYSIIAHHHSYLLLQNDLSLHGTAIVSALADADTVLCGLATIGPAIEAAVAQIMLNDVSLGLAVDGLANAALDQVQIETCRRIEEHAAATDRHASIIYSPGMVGWDVLESQPQVFELAPATEIGVTMNDNLLLMPLKSISFVIGLSSHPFGQTTMCAVCSLQQTCRYRGTGQHA